MYDKIMSELEMLDTIINYCFKCCNLHVEADTNSLHIKMSLLMYISCMYIFLLFR